MKMFNKYDLIFVLIIVFVVGYFLFSMNLKAKDISPENSSRVEINNTTIYLEIADTNEKRSLGLGGRDSLLQDYGMLFVFPKKDLYVFWMKGMRFPLDMIWISDNKIVDITKSAPVVKSGELPRYTSKAPANYVLEVNAGFTDEHNIKIGDTIKYE